MIWYFLYYWKCCFSCPELINPLVIVWLVFLGTFPTGLDSYQLASNGLSDGQLADLTLLTFSSTHILSSFNRSVPNVVFLSSLQSPLLNSISTDQVCNRKCLIFWPCSHPASWCPTHSLLLQQRAFLQRKSHFVYGSLSCPHHEENLQKPEDKGMMTTKFQGM